MRNMGTSWEGTKWKERAIPQETLGQRLGTVVRRLSRPLALCLFLAAVPVLALTVIVSDPTPASSGSCNVYTTIDNSVRTRSEARCKRPYGRHTVHADLYAERAFWKQIGSAHNTKSKGAFSVETNPKYVGCGKYLGEGRVSGQADDYTPYRYYCR